MSHQTIKLLLIEDNPGDARLVETYLDQIDDTTYHIVHSRSCGEGLDALKKIQPAVILLDMDLPDSQGMATFTSLNAAAGSIPIIVMTGVARDEIALQSVQAGAEDYLVKGEFDPHSLRRAVRYAIERARRHRAEEALHNTQYSLRIAREIQFLLFPVGRPHIRGFDIGGATFPAADVDGDYFDYLQLKNDNIAVTIGDACGHGLGAALLSARTHACLRTLSLSFDEPGHILTMANRVLASGMSSNRFVTMCIARIDPASRQLTYASAGHPAGYVLDRSGTVKASLDSTGFPLGVEDHTHYDAGPAVQLYSGDIVVVTTDGITEARSRGTKCFGIERTLNVVRDHRGETAMSIVEAMHDAVTGYCPDPMAVDDITAVVIKCE